jgi:hypothetical protein
MGVEDILEGFSQGIEEFLEIRRPFLLYEE